MQTTGRQVTDAILSDYAHGRLIDRLQMPHRPDKEVVYDLLDQFFSILFYGYYPCPARLADDPAEGLRMTVEDAMMRTRHLVISALPGDARYASWSTTELAEEAAEITDALFAAIPNVRALLMTDLEAIYEGDPAAENLEEIILAYPGFYAITIYRIAHELYRLRVPMLPRIMSERAHSRTGIDIHPGATIGASFFIDHGTGIVVGETTVIGEHVKLYQGVTLGAVSTRAGQGLRGQKRHPTIGNRVTLYACASVLGDTKIGDGCTIGSNVFITRDVPANTTVSLEEQELNFRNRS